MLQYYNDRQKLIQSTMERYKPVSSPSLTYVLVKLPCYSQTYMNNSGKVLPSLLKQGLNAKNIVVVHDELEKPFGVVDVKQGGSHRGHNGLRSLMEFCGQDFTRIRCGIGRPVHKEDVADYVLTVFSEPKDAVEAMINKAIVTIEQLVAQQ